MAGNSPKTIVISHHRVCQSFSFSLFDFCDFTTISGNGYGYLFSPKFDRVYLFKQTVMPEIIILTLIWI